MKKIKLFFMTNIFCMLFTMTVLAGSWKYDQQGWWYQKETGSYPVSTWQKIDDKWYYFDEEGYMKTGWIQSGDKWYYCGLNGRLVTDQWINGTYYVGSDGAMYVNTTTPDGKTVDNNGVKISLLYEKNDYVGHYVNEEEISTWESYMGYNFVISKIADGKIYGTYRQDTGAYSGYTADFTQGASIDGNGNFAINTRYEDVHSDYDTVNGQYIEFVDYGTMNCRLELKNGEPIIKTNYENFVNEDNKIYVKQ